MPGPFTHIYTTRGAPDLLRGDIIEGIVRLAGDDLAEDQTLAPELAAESGSARWAEIMRNWPTYTALGAVGPDLFFYRWRSSQGGAGHLCIRQESTL